VCRNIFPRRASVGQSNRLARRVDVTIPTMKFTAILLVMMSPGRFSGHVRSRRFCFR
jgi:hypothetical protein